MSQVLHSDAQVEQLPPIKQPLTDKISEWWQNNAPLATEKKQLFLKALQENGIVLDACTVADIDRRTIYRWRDSDPEFREAWNQALDEPVDKVERSLFNQAVSEKNVVATIFYLKGNRAKYRDRIAVDVNALDREIEDRLSSLESSTKDIIAEVIGGPSKQLTE